MAPHFRVSSDEFNRSSSILPGLPGQGVRTNTVTFGDIDSIGPAVEQILQSSSADVHAPAGSGKSTLLPRLLAASTGTIVFMVLPNQLLATQLYQFVATLPPLTSGFVRAHLCQSSEFIMPSDGVIYLGFPVLRELLASRGTGILQDSTLILDELHEFSPYPVTYKFMLVPGVRHLVRLHTTFSEKWLREPKLNEELRKSEGTLWNLPRWDFSESSDHWAKPCKGSTLVLCDTEDYFYSVSSKYREVSDTVCVLNSRMTGEAFTRAYEKVRSADYGVLIVDSFFRLAFHFGFDKVVDLDLAECQYIVSTGENAIEETPSPEEDAENMSGEAELSVELDVEICDLRAPLGSQTHSIETSAEEGSTNMVLEPQPLPKQVFALHEWGSIIDDLLKDRYCELDHSRKYTTRRIPQKLYLCSNNLTDTLLLVDDLIRRRPPDTDFVHLLDNRERWCALTALLEDYNTAILDSVAMRESLIHVILAHGLDPSDECAVKNVVFAVGHILSCFDEAIEKFKLVKRFLADASEIAPVVDFGANFGGRVNLYRNMFGKGFF